MYDSMACIHQVLTDGSELRSHNASDDWGHTISDVSEKVSDYCGFATVGAATANAIQKIVNWTQNGCENK